MSAINRWFRSGSRRPKPQPQPSDGWTPDPSPPTMPRLTHIPGPFVPRHYAYWSNAVVLSDSTYVFAGHVDGQRRLFQIGPHGEFNEVPRNYLPAWSTTEGWYWNRVGDVYHLSDDGSSLVRLNPFTGTPSVFVLIARSATHLWQPHSSDDGEVHSATVQGVPSRLGTIVNYRGRRLDFPAIGALDESILTKDGEWLVILEENFNRVIRLATGEERRITQQEGAVGHCDTGSNFIVGEDDHHGACVVWSFPEFSRRELFSTWNMGHVSVKGNRILHSDNEKIGLVDAETGAYQELLRHGVQVTDYDSQIRANLSPCGMRAFWIANGDIHVLAI